MIKIFSTVITITLTVYSLHAAEYHVSPNGLDSNKGSRVEPFKTISAAADIARPGDVITVHTGTYRERVNPPRGGASDDQRIVYQAAPGEKVEVKGSEVIKGWGRVQNDTWKVILPNSFFGDFNPYHDVIGGEWHKNIGYPRHTGTVYLNGTWMDEAKTLEQVVAPVGKRPCWKAKVDENTTTIWAQFKGVDPNQELTEVNVRQTVFYPEKPGMHYITLRGFTLEHAATPWAPPTTEQIGLVGTHWSKGWIIENNTIRYSTCTGITLGKYNDPKDAKARATADAYNNTIEWALEHGWTKDTVGGHLVRNNHIYHCEQAGIVGSLGAIFSTVTGNTIHDINQRKLRAGAEIAGVKFHAAIDSIISHNHIYRCKGAGGIWLDWMAQGARVSGNLLHDNSTDLFFEVNHGPLLVDDNIFMSSNFLRDWSEGTAFAHNLVRGKASVKPQGRTTPVHKPHSTQIVKLSKIACGDNRFYNNIFINGSDLKPYQKFSDCTIMQGNVFSKSTASLVDQADGTYLDLELGEPPAGEYLLVTSDLLGLAKVPNQRFEQPNGAACRLDTDYFGKKRIPENPAPGPFAARRGKEIRLKVWPTRQPMEKK